MKAQIQVETSYIVNCATQVELPEGKSLTDISDVWVKWGTIHVVFKDESEHEVEGDGGSLDDVDWKRPSSMTVFPCDENGDPNYDAEPIAED